MSDGIIDRAALRRLLDLIGGDPDDLDELLADFRETAPQLASQINAAAEIGDLETLRIAAHTLKSNARDFGATRLSSFCETLDRDCRNGAVSDPRAVADAIRSEEALVRQALSGICAEDLRD
jgi:HPt (histidine-containing phosphotransfer) domain-containing protein